MTARHWILPLCTTAALLAACGPAARQAAEPAQERGARRMVLIDEAQLSRRSGTLLSVLRYDAGPVEVRETSGCPEITLRGKKRFHGGATPSIYVNGMRATNTCVLHDFAVADVRRVEIYPSGVTSRPGYVNSSDGLILVFLQGSSEIAER